VDLGGSSIDPRVVTAGDQVTVRQNTISNTDAVVLVDFELFDSSGNQVLQSVVPDQHVLVGLVGSTSTALTIPDDLPAGAYTLKVGIYSNDGQTQYSWTDSAGTLTVKAAPPTAADAP
jgi:hypothetical protein